MIHKNKYITTPVRADLADELFQEAVEKSKKSGKWISKTKLLEQILAERYDLEALIKENEISKK